ASALSQMIEARQLLLLSASGFAVSAILPVFFRDPHSSRAEPQTRPRESRGLAASAAFVWRQQYARWVVVLLGLSAVGVTLADYLFKSTIAAQVSKAELASYFATVNLVVNVFSLAVQLWVVSWLVRRFSVMAGLAVLPLLLLCGGLGMMLSGS